MIARNDTNARRNIARIHISVHGNINDHDGAYITAHVNQQLADGGDSATGTSKLGLLDNLLEALKAAEPRDNKLKGELGAQTQRNRIVSTAWSISPLQLLITFIWRRLAGVSSDRSAAQNLRVLIVQTIKSHNNQPQSTESQ